MDSDEVDLDVLKARHNAEANKFVRDNLMTGAIKYLSEGDNKSAMVAKVSETKFDNFLKKLEPQHSTTQNEDRTFVEWFKVTDTVAYCGQVNKRGQPHGLGINISSKYNEIYIGFHANKGLLPGKYIFINKNGVFN